jgi:hypothetical protein
MSYLVGHTVCPTDGGTEISDRKLDDYSGLGDATPEYLDRWTATQAAPKAPQRKRPCRSRALSLILTVRSLNCASASPDQGLVALTSLPDPASPRVPAGARRKRRARPRARKVQG